MPLCKKALPALATLGVGEGGEASCVQHMSFLDTNCYGKRERVCCDFSFFS